MSSSGLPCTGQTSIYWGDSSERPRRRFRDWRVCPMRDMGLFYPGDKKAQGALLMYMPGGICKQDWDRPLLVLSSDRTRGKGLKTKKEEILSKQNKNISLKVWLSTGTGCPQRLWSLHPWKTLSLPQKSLWFTYEMGKFC